MKSDLSLKRKRMVGAGVGFWLFSFLSFAWLPSAFENDEVFGRFYMSLIAAGSFVIVVVPGYPAIKGSLLILIALNPVLVGLLGIRGSPFTLFDAAISCVIVFASLSLGMILHFVRLLLPSFRKHGGF